MTSTDFSSSACCNEIKQMLTSGEFEAAKSKIDAYLQEHPDNSYCLFLLGRYYDLQHSYDLSVETYTKAINSDNSNPKCY